MAFGKIHVDLKSASKVAHKRRQTKAKEQQKESEQVKVVMCEWDILLLVEFSVSDHFKCNYSRNPCTSIAFQWSVLVTLAHILAEQKVGCNF